MGFAYLFFEKFKDRDYLLGVDMLRKVFFVSTLGSTLLMGLWYWFKRRQLDYRIFLMASFKIYLSVFLAFIVVPYEYLMITGNFVSIAIFAEQMRYKPSSRTS